MNLDQIKQLSTPWLVTIAGVSAPDAEDSPGAVFLRSWRDTYVIEHDCIRNADHPRDEINDLLETSYSRTQAWQIFTDLALWNWSDLDDGVLGDITWPKISDMAETVVHEVARTLLLRLWQDDSANPDHEDYEDPDAED